MQKIKKTILRERMLEQLGHENVTVFKGLKKELPGVTDEAIQSMTATIMIACDKGCTYVQADFDYPAETTPDAPAKQTPATEIKTNGQAPSGKTPEQIAQDVKERGGDQASPEQKAELERLAKLHGTAPVEYPNEKGKALEKAAGVEPYDKAAKRWDACTCGNTDINKTSGAGRQYQACSKCKLFLNSDGLIKPFPRDSGQRRVDGKVN